MLAVCWNPDAETSVLSQLIVDNFRTGWGSLSRLQTRFPAGLAG
jgi:hypothetical protein